MDTPRLIATLLAAALCCSAPVHAGQSSGAQALFRDYALDEPWRQRWGVPWVQRAGATEPLPREAVPAGERGLVVHYPKGAVGPSDGGLQFPASFADMPRVPADRDAVYLTYYVKFAEGFDFGRGGKLPGLMGGGDSWTRSGGDQPDGTDGWTLRLMWREQGQATVYSYLPPSPNGQYGGGDWGMDLHLHRQFETGRWHRIEQYVRVNDPGEENGQLRMWLDGELVLDLDDVTYRTEANGMGRPGGVFFSTFHGGSEPDWAPERDSRAHFAGFTVSAERLGGR